MKYLISPRAMLESERRYFEKSGVKSIDVMERAAQALADVIIDTLPEGSRLYFACGTGGNGGDGTACARLLKNRYLCTIIQPAAPTSPDAIENLRRAKECGIPVMEAPQDSPDAWVDCLFGTGLSRAPEGKFARLMEDMRYDVSFGAKLYACDIPSGLNGSTGELYEPFVFAHHTVTFQFIKTGMMLQEGLDVCGKIHVADVGFPREAFGPFDAQLLDANDLRSAFYPRKRNIHKGVCGHLLIVAGSFGMAGAAAMCVSAALRSGAGLVTIACPVSIVPILQTIAPGAMCVPLAERDGAISAEAIPELARTLKGKDAVVIGCGMSTRADLAVVRTVLESKLPAVVDADALNLLATSPAVRELLRSRHIITPHPGEAARLLEPRQKKLLTDPIEAARALQGWGATVLYKGASCVITDGKETYVSSSGCCGMARGGSGDILAGIMGALLAEKSGRTPAMSAALASELHGLAGELAQKKYGQYAMNARDILEFLPEVFPV